MGPELDSLFNNASPEIRTVYNSVIGILKKSGPLEIHPGDEAIILGNPNAFATVYIGRSSLTIEMAVPAEAAEASRGMTAMGDGSATVRLRLTPINPISREDRQLLEAAYTFRK